MGTLRHSLRLSDGFQERDQIHELQPTKGLYHWVYHQCKFHLHQNGNGRLKGKMHVPEPFLSHRMEKHIYSQTFHREFCFRS